MLAKDKDDLKNHRSAMEYEWLETNGLGGWSGSSIIGAHTRRYHGLLVAAIVPPTERMLLLSRLDETIVVGNKRIELGCNFYPGDTIYPNGNQFLSQFSKAIIPRWIIDAEAIQLKKSICMLHEENTVVLSYEVLKADEVFNLELLPMIAARGYHCLQHEGSTLHWDVEFSDGIFHNKPDENVSVFIHVPGAAYHHDPKWYHRFQYPVEQYRGLEYEEDLLNHGKFSVSLKQGDQLGIIVSTENPSGRDAFSLMSKEMDRRKRLIKKNYNDESIGQLILAADQFIVRRGDGLKTVIAGYHWFTDWGRDTMISLPGLCLSTGRYDDAKKIIRAFAEAVSEGMLPNRFQDNAQPPEYNNVDGTLWYFIAVYKYWQATNDNDFVLNEILPVLKDIIDWHFKGTRYNIKVDKDGLLFAGEAGQQLTWMDAKVGDWVVTPRMGKPVEIQALWYNALMILSALLEKT